VPKVIGANSKLKEEGMGVAVEGSFMKELWVLSKTLKNIIPPLEGRMRNQRRMSKPCYKDTKRSKMEREGFVDQKWTR
jgi:hypothetical protein